MNQNKEKYLVNNSTQMWPQCRTTGQMLKLGDLWGHSPRSLAEGGHGRCGTEQSRSGVSVTVRAVTLS